MAIKYYLAFVGSLAVYMMLMATPTQTTYAQTNNDCSVSFDFDGNGYGWETETATVANGRLEQLGNNVSVLTFSELTAVMPTTRTASINTDGVYMAWEQYRDDDYTGYPPTDTAGAHIVHREGGASNNSIGNQNNNVIVRQLNAESGYTIDSIKLFIGSSPTHTYYIDNLFIHIPCDNIRAESSLADFGDPIGVVLPAPLPIPTTEPHLQGYITEMQNQFWDYQYLLDFTSAMLTAWQIGYNQEALAISAIIFAIGVGFGIIRMLIARNGEEEV